VIKSGVTVRIIDVKLVVLLIRLFSSGDQIRGHGSNYRRRAGGAVDKIV
jgi:hypothetical protein